jgi:hypothetical protein
MALQEMRHKKQTRAKPVEEMQRQIETERDTAIPHTETRLKDIQIENENARTTL